MDQVLVAPMRSSLVLTIRALSPGKGFNSSLGSSEPAFSGLLSVRLRFPVSFALRASSYAATSSEVSVIAVGLRLSILSVNGVGDTGLELCGILEGGL